jgi:hypothetical protein
MFLDPNMPPINILSMTPPLAISASNKAHALRSRGGPTFTIVFYEIKHVI